MPGRRNPISDDLKIRFSTACGEVEEITGERPHLATLHRWSTRGLKGVKLQVQYCGGHRRTTRKWLLEFFENVTAAAMGETVRRESSSTERSVEKELDAAGI